ncbi:MAG: hypothetical protein OHK0017_00390 [Patescibacteria group bacterium]
MAYNLDLKIFFARNFTPEKIKSFTFNGLLGLALSIILCLPVLAEYIPPDRGVPGRREGGGTRGGGKPTLKELVLKYYSNKPSL